MQDKLRLFKLDLVAQEEGIHTQPLGEETLQSSLVEHLLS